MWHDSNHNYKHKYFKTHKKDSHDRVLYKKNTQESKYDPQTKSSKSKVSEQGKTSP